MIRRFLTLSVLVSSFALGASELASDPASAATAGRHALVGTFKLEPGACAGASVTGTYFQMIFPNGSVANGKFFDNPDSTCANKAYTLVVPGVQGGLVTGKYQPNPTPAFNAQGGALADSIILPQSFTAIDFSIATNENDPQTGLKVPAPAISVKKGKLSGRVEAWSAWWNKTLLQPGFAQAGRLGPRADSATLGHLQLEDPCLRDHVDKPGSRRALQRLHRVLAPDGHLLPGQVRRERLGVRRLLRAPAEPCGLGRGVWLVADRHTGSTPASSHRDLTVRRRLEGSMGVPTSG